MDVRESNKRFLQEDKIMEIIKNIKEIEKFVDDFSFLLFGRDYILCGKKVFSLQILFRSIQLTMGSIINCCEHYCVADANVLTRKYRDDIFFCLYLIVYDANYKKGNKEVYVDIENNISKWLNNSLQNLYISDVFKAIGKQPDLLQVIKKYDLQSSFKVINTKLNDFVHSNGIAFYNENIINSDRKIIEEKLRGIENNIRYITVSFLFLLVLCSPGYIMSTDYVECLDMGTPPPDYSELWVAPFVKSFLKDNLKIIDDNCYNYIRENSSMLFD